LKTVTGRRQRPQRQQSPGGGGSVVFAESAGQQLGGIAQSSRRRPRRSEELGYRPDLRLTLDLYHAQIGEGNLIDLVERALPWIGEIQVADVPGRCEPGTGEISYPAIARVLAELGYDGTVAMEAWAAEDSDLALERFRSAFTPVTLSTVTHGGLS
jgi:sugar phosphate isomerase/epimerase